MFGWRKKTPGGPQPKKIGDILDAYGELLEKYPGAIIDTLMLPIPKEEMKALLKTAYSKANNQRERDNHGAVFICLSRFQNGVGQKPLMAPVGGGNIEHLKANFDAEMGVLDAWIRWNNLSLAESEILLAEWKRFQGVEPI